MASSPLPGGSRHVGRVVDPSVREDGEPEPAVELEVEPRVSTSASNEPKTAADADDEGDRPTPAPPPPSTSASSPHAASSPNAAPSSATASSPTAVTASSPTTASSPIAAPSITATPAPIHELDPAERAAQLRGGRARDLLLERAQATREAASDSASGLGDLDEVGKTEGEALNESDFGPPATRAPSAPFLGSSPAGRLSPNWVAVFGTLLGVATVASLVALGMNLDVKLPAPTAAPSASTVVPSEAQVTPAPPPPPAKPKRARSKLPSPWRIADAKGDPQLKFVEDRVGSDPFLKALQRAGVETRETYRILLSMKGVRDFDRCKAKDRFSVLIERGTSKVKAFEYIENPEEVYQSREGADGLLKSAKLDLKVERGQFAGALVYDGKSFDTSAEQGGFERGLAKVVSKALDGHLALDELERGSRIRVIAQEVTVLGEFARYSGIEALEVRGADESKPPFRVYYFASGGERGYFDAEGHSPYEGGWRKPMRDAPMTSPFNLKRMHPILKKTMPHLGIDYGAPTGTPVGAASYGTVEFASYIGATGNLVRIAHANGIETGYAHLSRFAEGLKVGDKVKRLQVIGYVGSTGRSTGPHLHFSARRNGEFIDPASLNLDSMRTLSRESRAAFTEVKAKYDAALEAIPLPATLAPVPSVPSAAAAPGSAASAVSAPQASPTSDPGQDDEDDETPAGAAPPAAPGAAAKPAGKPGSAVYLSDKELLRLQGATDEGEVAE